jgi:hypothetical protein
MGNLVHFAIARPSAALFTEHIDELSEHLFAPLYSREDALTATIGGATVSAMPVVHMDNSTVYWLREGTLEEISWKATAAQRERLHAGIAATPAQRPASLEESVVVGAYFTDQFHTLRQAPRAWLESIGALAQEYLRRDLDFPYAIGQTIVQVPVALDADELYLHYGNEQVWLTEKELTEIERVVPDYRRRVHTLLHTFATHGAYRTTSLTMSIMRLL